jgi:hypothetical protein
MYVLADHQPLDIAIEVLQPLMGWGPIDDGVSMSC